MPRLFDSVTAIALTPALLDGIAAGDRDAFTALVAPHLPALLGFAVRVAGDHGTGEDALQDVLAQAYTTLQRKPRAELEHLAVRPWLFKSVIHRIRRQRRRLRESPAGLAMHTGATIDTETTAARRAALMLVDRELRRLPRDWRAAILLRHHAGYAYEEVARMLDRPAGTVKAWVHRGTRVVRERLQDELAEGGLP